MRAIASELTSFRRSSPLGLVESPHRFDSQPPCRQFPMLLLYTLMSVRSSLNSYTFSSIFFAFPIVKLNAIVILHSNGDELHGHWVTQIHRTSNVFADFR